MSARGVLREWAPPLGVLVGVLGLWWAVAVGWKLPPYLLPTPLDVAKAVLDQPGALLNATLLTAGAALTGFLASLVGGTVAAVVFAQSRVIERSLYPYAIFLQTVPIVAIAPLIILWCGTGFRSVVLIAFIISVFPIITNATAGLTSVNRSLLELFEVYNATRWQRLTRLTLPHAIPSLVTGARTASGLSVIGAIVGEFFAGLGSQHRGLGYWITVSAGQLKTANLFAAVLASAVLGLLIFGAVSLVGHQATRRWQD